MASWLQATSPSPANKLASIVERLETLAQKDLNSMTNCIHEMTRSHTYQEIAEYAGKVVNGVGHILDFVGNIAQIHPIAGAVVQAVQGVVNLEKLRHENHAHIAQVHGSMIMAIFHLRVLVPITHDELEHGKDELHELLITTFTHMEATIQEFGRFVDLYHRCLQKLMKVLLAHHHKAKLEDYRTRFEKHRIELDRVMATRSTSKTLQRLEKITSNTEDILHRLPVFDPELAHIEGLIAEKGGAHCVIHDDKLLAEIAEKLGERVTDDMKQMLRQDFDELLRNHAARYELKMQSLESTIMASVEASRAALSRQLDHGIHEWIEDRDIRGLWRENSWKSSVKCRTFVEALHEYYMMKFNKPDSDEDTNSTTGVFSRLMSYVYYQSDTQVNHHDAWTVDFFSRVMYHSAIGDIIDEDGSGFITVSEMNAFCKSQRRPADWSIPQWFAFCAAGWYNNNAWYTRSIKEMLEEITQDLGSIKADTHGDWQAVRIIMTHLKPLLFVEDVEEVAQAQSTVPHNLRRLQEEYRRNECEKIVANLKKFRYHLEDRSAVVAVVGDTRTELHIMCIFYALVTHLHHLVKTRARHQATRLVELGNVEDLATSCMVTYLAFERRIHEITRGWRAQGHDIDLQLGRYADGLFRNMNRDALKRMTALRELSKYLFGPSIPPQYRGMIEASSYVPQSKVDELRTSITVLTDRVSELEARLREQIVLPPATTIRARLLRLRRVNQPVEKSRTEEEEKVKYPPVGPGSAVAVRKRASWPRRKVSQALLKWAIMLAAMEDESRIIHT